MIPWNKLPSHLQKAILAMVVVFGGTSAACRLAPPICDPPPPPATTPMLCDPPPPPSVTPGPRLTPTCTPTPMICDPPPPPTVITPMICDPPPPPPSVTVAPGQRFTVKVVQIAPDADLPGVGIRGSIVDPQGRPLGGLPIIVEHEGESRFFSDGFGTFSAGFPQAGIYTVSIEGDETSRLTLELKRHDVARVEWVETRPESQSPLPLAEVRVVDIVWQDGLTFSAETLWPGARYRWSASGGTLIEEEGNVIWQPPVEPGRYLLQVVADWGRMGLAVDAIVLVVGDDGSLTFG